MFFPFARHACRCSYLQTIGQRKVPAERAAIIFSLDPVYGTFVQLTQRADSVFFWHQLQFRAPTMCGTRLKHTTSSSSSYPDEQHTRRLTFFFVLAIQGRFSPVSFWTNALGRWDMQGCVLIFRKNLFRRHADSIVGPQLMMNSSHLCSGAHNQNGFKMT